MDKDIRTEEVRRAMAGDRGAFERLYSAYKDKLFMFVIKNVGRREWAEDIVSETFLAAMEGIGGLRNEGAFAGWLYSIAYKKCADRINEIKRSGSFRNEQEQESAMMECSLNEPVELPEDYAVNAERRRELRTVIDGLKPEMKNAVMLYYYQELPVSEVAKALGTTEGAARKRLFDARKKIRSSLEMLCEKGMVLCSAPMSAVLEELMEGESAPAVGTAAKVSGLSALKIAVAAVGAAAVIGVPIALKSAKGSIGGEMGGNTPTTLTSGTDFAEIPIEMIEDYMWTNEEKGAELIVFRSGDKIIDLSSCSEVHGLELEDIDEGQFIKVSADITRASGGVAGFQNEPFIDKLISTEPMEVKEAIAAADIAHLNEGIPTVNHRICFYEWGEQIYIFYYSSRLCVYEEGSEPRYYENYEPHKIPDLCFIKYTEYEKGGAASQFLDWRGRVYSAADGQMYGSDEINDMLKYDKKLSGVELVKYVNAAEVLENYLDTLSICRDPDYGLDEPQTLPAVEDDHVWWYAYINDSTVPLHEKKSMMQVNSKDPAADEVYRWLDEILRSEDSE
ncbi:MAG: RNA polymerase sigma factor [Ruminococcus sp.]|nr:RNA polymerase sigma factor [Ruminococcus sp.]